MKVLIVSNMYPDKGHPFYGTFVKKFTDELDVLGIDYSKSVMYLADSKIKKALNYILFYIKTYIKILFNSYDIVYVHYASHSSAPVLLAKKIKHFKLFTNVHGSDVVPENKKQEKFQKYTIAALERSDKVIVPSDYFKEFIVKKYNLNKSSIYIYPSGGIDSNTFHKNNNEEIQNFKEKYSFKDRGITFGMAGRITEGKGWDTFLRAISITKKSSIHANFVYVGNGREEDKFNELIEKLDIKDSVTLLNLLPQDQLSLFYSSIDFLIFPSKREGESLGLVPLEAMACGTPVISANFAAPKDYMIDGVNGYLFDADDEVDLSEVIMKVVNSKETSILLENVLETAKPYYRQNIRAALRKIFEL